MGVDYSPYARGRPAVAALAFERKREEDSLLVAADPGISRELLDRQFRGLAYAASAKRTVTNFCANRLDGRHEWHANSGSFKQADAGAGRLGQAQILERELGLAGWYVMGMESLNSAARAAGFAMAASDDPHDEIRAEGKADETQWRPGEAVLLHGPPRSRRRPRVGDWVRSVLGLFGRRAPASPA